ncbi:MAG TPA: 3-phosphoshikimate 1-carboxyvinyltransferase [Candidatus Eremiobacteraceae bacterium]|nr:3-phosphoshikimate 1-carboxyvinyltransferase [Candidatus Eremiobacteraceae bacterium]
MSVLRLGAPTAFGKNFRVPGDKSISHRAVMLAAGARGTTTIRGLNRGEDVAATIAAMRSVGAAIEESADVVRVTGRPFAREAGNVDCGNSGTTIRLAMGLLAGRTTCTLDGDVSLRRRPMERAAQPLRLMGAAIETTAGTPPVRITRSEGRLRGIDYRLPIASAQVKSALLLAGLRAGGATTVQSPHPSRDHTERMLSAMGVKIDSRGDTVRIEPGELTAIEELLIPGDLSAAVYFITVIAMSSRANADLIDVGVNPSRVAALDVMRRMGVEFATLDEEILSNEPRAHISVAGGAPLRSVQIGADDVPNCIDEIPALCALAALAGVRLEVRGAAELRVKESDRIAATAGLLRAFGARVDELDDGLIVGEGRSLRAPGRVGTLGDHRIGLTAATLAAALASPIEIDDADCIATSFPSFAAHWSAAFGCRIER